MKVQATWWQDFNVIGLAYDGVGVLVLWAPSLWRLGETVKAESGSYFDFNVHALRGAVRARLDLTFGSLVLFSGFLAQFVAALGFTPVSSFAAVLWAVPIVFVPAYIFGVRSILASRYSARLAAELTEEQKDRLAAKKKPAG